MPLPYDFFRIRNIFDPTRQPDQYGNMPDSTGLSGMGESSGMFRSPRVSPFFSMDSPNAMSSADEINQIMRQMYTPEHAMTDRLGSLIDQQPVRREPNLFGKIGGALAGIAYGPEQQQKYMDAPFDEQMKDWQAKYTPTLAAANLERYNNANERQLAYQTAQAITSARQQKTREDAENRRETKSAADIARDKTKNQISEFRAKNPDWKTTIGENGNVWLVPPRPDMGSPVDTKLDAASATDLEKHNWKLGEIEAGIQGRIRVKETPDARLGNKDDPRNWSVQTLYDKEGNPIGMASVNKVTQEVKPIPADSALPDADKTDSGGFRNKPPLLPAQQQHVTENNIQAWLVDHPEDQGFFSKDPTTGLWKVVPPGKNKLGYATGPTPEKYEQIKRAVQGNTQYKQRLKQAPGRQGTTSKGTPYTILD